MSSHPDLESKSVNYIILGEDIDKDRALVVINGQPFYRSTGFNSSGYKLLLSNPPEVLDPYTLYFSIIQDDFSGPLLKYTLLNLHGEKAVGKIEELAGCDISALAALQQSEERRLESYQAIYGDRYREILEMNQEDLNKAEIELQDDHLDEILKITYRKGYTQSSAKGGWLPLLMVAGNEQIISTKSLPDIYDKNKALLNSVIEENSHDYIIKPHAFLKEEILKAESIKVNSDFSSKHAERIGLKRFLITSSRLNPQHYTDQQLTAAGLNKQELRLARQAISLKAKPQFLCDNGDRVNQWLSDNGATYINDLFQAKKPISIATDSKWKNLLPTNGRFFQYYSTPKTKVKSSTDKKFPSLLAKEDKKKNPLSSTVKAEVVTPRISTSNNPTAL